MNEKSCLNKTVFFFYSPIILLKKFKFFDSDRLLDCIWKLKKLEYSYGIKPKTTFICSQKDKKNKSKIIITIHYKKSLDLVNFPCHLTFVIIIIKQ
jgi:hypothetical protein